VQLEKLRVLKLNNNRWNCNCDILELMQWITLRREQAPAHTPVKCFEGQVYRKYWTRAGGNKPCRLSTTTETPLGIQGEFTTDMTEDLPTVSVGITQSLKPIPHKTSQGAEERAVTGEAGLRTKPESENVGWNSLLSWNVNTLTVFVILPITLGVAVFVSLIAVNYIVKRVKDHPTQNDIQEKYKHNAGLFSHMPLLNLHLSTDHTKQNAGYGNRSSYGVGGSEYHVYERIE
jgi:hypothetical protein